MSVALKAQKAPDKNGARINCDFCGRSGHMKMNCFLSPKILKNKLPPKLLKLLKDEKPNDEIEKYTTNLNGIKFAGSVISGNQVLLGEGQPCSKSCITSPLAFIFGTFLSSSSTRKVSQSFSDSGATVHISNEKSDCVPSTLIPCFLQWLLTKWRRDGEVWLTSKTFIHEPNVRTVYTLGHSLYKNTVGCFWNANQICARFLSKGAKKSTNERTNQNAAILNHDNLTKFLQLELLSRSTVCSDILIERASKQKINGKRHEASLDKFSNKSRDRHISDNVEENISRY